MNRIKNTMMCLTFLTAPWQPLSMSAQTATGTAAHPLILTPQEQRISGEERILCYDIASTIPYQIEVSADWIKVEQKDNQCIYAMVEQNSSDQERTAHINFRNKELSITRQISIHQAAQSQDGDNASIQSFSIGNFTGKIEGDQINLTICADDVDLNAVTPTVEVCKGATYFPTGPVDLNQPNYFTVTSPNGKKKKTYLVKAEKTYRNKQLLDANRVFFTGALNNHAQAGVAGDEQNQKKFFDYTNEWDTTSDTLVWGIDVVKAGSLGITPLLGVPVENRASTVEISVDGEKKVISLYATHGLTTFSEQSTALFHLDKPGRHTVKMAMKSKKSSARDLAYAKGIYVSGDAAEALKPVVLRWRPSAIHCKWQNTANPSRIEIAVHEVTIKSDHIGSYSPITTPFGYYGSTWDPQKQQFGGINFSLWSPFENGNPPSVEKFSHLIAAGEGMRIDGFNHEGTGVKCRGDNPFASMQGQRTQVLALMKVPGKPYDVYYSYYWNTNTKKWVLFGCGKKYNDKNPSYLWTGAFVEVPGAANKQRSNHIKREVHFRGWYIDANKKIFPINKMVVNGSLDPYSYKKWSKNDEGDFIMEMGGFDQLEKSKPASIVISKKGELPEYLNEDNMKSFGQLPVSIQTETPTAVTDHSAQLNFKVDTFGTSPTVNLYWGIKDGLTFTDQNRGNGGVVKWQNVETLSPGNTTFSHRIEGLKPGTKYYYRLQIVNAEGETWSWDTESFVTQP